MFRLAVMLKEDRNACCGALLVLAMTLLIYDEEVLAGCPPGEDRHRLGLDSTSYGAQVRVTMKYLAVSNDLQLLKARFGYQC